MKKLISVLLVLTIVLGSFGTAFAAEEPEKSGVSGFDSLQGTKTAEYDPDADLYTITLSIPGVDTDAEPDEKLYNEVIVMLDASDSQDQNIEDLKGYVLSLGEQFLTEDGHTHLVLMGFGWSATDVETYTTYSELQEKIAEFDQEDFLYGVSATNCEVAFTWIQSHIENSPNLNEAVVLFCSDGHANMDEELWPWHRMCEDADADILKWHYKSWTTQTIVESAGIPAQKMCVMEKSADYLDATIRLVEKYNSELSLDTSDVAAVDAVGALIKEHAAEWVNEILKDMYAAKGYEPDEFLTASQFEHVLWDYIRNLGHGYEERSDSLADLFLMLTLNCGRYMTDFWGAKTGFGSRAADACDVLGNNEKVKSIYLIGLADDQNPSTTKMAVNHWMNPGSEDEARVTTKKAHFYQSKDFSAAMELMMGDIATTIVTMPVVKPVVTDPMSDCVDFDPESLVLTSDGEVIWKYADKDDEDGGWKIPETERPVEGSPIELKKDADTGKYTIEWTVKDDNLLITDRFAIRYSVKLNDKVSSGANDLNDTTTVSYGEIIAPIDVPSVSFHNITVNYLIKGTETKLGESYVTELEKEGESYDVYDDAYEPNFGRYFFTEKDGDDYAGTLDTDKVINLYYEYVAPYRPPVSGGTEELPDEEPPLAGEPDTGEEVLDESTELNEEDIPLSDLPGGIGGGDDLEILDDEVPLADAPETGDSNAFALMSVFSVLTLAALAFDRKKWKMTE